MGESISKFDPRYDAQMLAEAAAINASPQRLLAAQGAAQLLKEEAEAKVVDLSRIAVGLYDHPTSIAAREGRKLVASSK
jgi:hypothetical protein